MQEQLCRKCYGSVRQCECAALRIALKINAGEHPAFTAANAAGDYATRKALRVGQLADVFMGVLIVWLIGRADGTVTPVTLEQFEAFPEEVRAEFERRGSLGSALKRGAEIIAEGRGVN